MRPVDVAARRLLVVEDEADIAESIRMRLEHEGHSVRIAATRASAIKSLQTEPPDLVVLDIRLPDGSGYDVLKFIREDVALRETPVIILTCLGATEEIEDGFIAGANAYHPKPNLDRLPAAIECLIAETQTRASFSARSPNSLDREDQ